MPGAGREETPTAASQDGGYQDVLCRGGRIDMYGCGQSDALVYRASCIMPCVLCCNAFLEDVHVCLSA